MSRDELPQYTPNTAVMSFETPPRPFHSLWTTPDANPGTPTITGTGLQTYPASLATPSSQSHQTSVKRSHKRKSDENSGQSVSKKAWNSRSLGLLSDSTTSNLPPEMGTPDEVSDPDADKLNSFFSFLQETLKWTFGELLYHAIKGKSPGVKRTWIILRHILHPEGLLNLKGSVAGFWDIQRPDNALKIFTSVTN